MLLIAWSSSAAAELVVVAPVPWQVSQRGVPARIELSGTGLFAAGSRIECRLLTASMGPEPAPPLPAAASAWRPLAVEPADPTAPNRARASVDLPAGGWYRLEVRAASAGIAAVEPFGVGEVFVVAGQSYATNTNDERLVVADIAPVRSTATPIEYVRAMRDLPLAAFSQRLDIKEALAPAIPDPMVRGFLTLNLVSGPAGFAWTVNLESIEQNFDSILGFPEVPAGRPFTQPTLFLVGGRSDYVRPEHHPEIRRLFPAATIEVIERAGHWVHADSADAFVAAVDAFLSPRPAPA